MVRVLALALLLSPLAACRNSETPCEHDAKLAYQYAILDGANEASAQAEADAFLAGCNEAFEKRGDYDHLYLDGRCTTLETPNSSN